MIGGWFRLVVNIIQKYGIVDDDIYNFDETGFAIGIASTSRVVTTTDRRGRPPQLQPGDREWATVIETINATGWYLPPMVILKGKVHISVWYENNELPANWTIALSKNGWTSNELGLHWLKHVFEPNTASRTVGSHRLLILDGHGSHATPEFDQYCKDRNIITLCMPAHSSHLLQPLDVGCFSVLKRSYGTQVAEFMRLGINHIDKAEFLYALKLARNSALTESNIRTAFAATGLVPRNPDRVLSTLQRPITPPSLPTIVQERWQPETPHNIAQLEQQVAIIKGYIIRRSKSPPTPTDIALNQLAKGCQIAMQSAVLLAAENEQLRSANERQKRKKQLKRRFISKANVITVADTSVLLQTAQKPQVVVDDGAFDEPILAQDDDVETEPQAITCFICRGSNHFARDCNKYR